MEKTQRGCTILLSRTHPGFLVKLFEVEVPEIQEGIIKVVGAAREPGERAKISVYSQDPSIDPIGACVGVKGSRVQAVVQELEGRRSISYRGARTRPSSSAMPLRPRGFPRST